jgi:hypothetical protein
MNDVYNIEKFPIPEEGKYKNLGYLLGITIDGDDPCISKVHLHFERQGVKTVYVLEDGDKESIIKELIQWFQIQLINQVKHGTQDVKLIIEKVGGELKIDMP